MSAAVDRALVYRIFAAALERDAGAREGFVSHSCCGDAELLREVTELLALAAQGPAPTSALLGGTAVPLRSLIGQEYGQFRLLELIGQGGMGVIYRAERTDGVPQAVAVKLLAGETTPASAALFVHEAKLLARLDHPGIARLIDVGVKNGERWIALELVRGEPIDRYCESRHLPLRERLKLLCVVADAVAAAHRVLVVHRDIKPSNVLVTAEGRPKLIDFGIATGLNPGQTGSEAGADIQRLFTPNYAAPEQVLGQPATVATDVFGLGALAYRVLSGTAPFAKSSSPVGYLVAVTQQTLAAPSAAALAGGMARARARQLRGDLDAIVLKALERAPSQRYADAQELRADLHRYLDGLPVSARPATVSYRALRFGRRHALSLGLSLVLVLALSAGAIFYGLQARRVAQAQGMAARRDAFLESLLKAADPRAGRRNMSVAELLDSAAAELDRKLAGEPRVEASMLGLIAATNVGLGRYAEGLTANDRQLAILRMQGSALEIGQALTTRGELLREQGEWQRAEPVLQEAVALLRPLQRPADLCPALYLLGVVRAHLNREQDAESIYREVIGIESRGDDELKGQRAYPYHALAVLLGEQGRYAEALQWAHAAVELAARSLPPEHPDLLAFETTYAGALTNVHRGTESEQLLRAVSATETRILGANHKDTLLSRLLLIGALRDAHRDGEAAATALDVAQRLQSLLGADNLYALMAWEEYGSATCNDHHERTGLEVLERISSARRRLLPAGSWLIHQADADLGVCLYRAGRYAAAETTLLGAAAGLEATRGGGHRATQQAYRALRDLYAATGRTADAAHWSAKLVL